MLLRLLTAAYGTGPPHRDVRIHGEYCRVSGPFSEVDGLLADRAAVKDLAGKAWYRTSVHWHDPWGHAAVHIRRDSLAAAPWLLGRAQCALSDRDNENEV